MYINEELKISFTYIYKRSAVSNFYGFQLTPKKYKFETAGFHS